MCVCVLRGGGQWSDMLQGCYHSNSRMGQRVAMAPRSQGQGEGLEGSRSLPVYMCVCVLIGRERAGEGERCPFQLYWVC